MNNRFRVHMNGTSKDELFHQHQTVLLLAQELEEALRRAVPNMRDYYHLDDGVGKLKESQEEHRAMVARIQEVQTWAIEGALTAQGDEVA